MKSSIQTLSRFANIPTKYNGINFRSRLEARWAAFFDQLKWEWEYEPIDLNGWIPDFIIKGTNNVLVEVKPYDISQLSWEDISEYLESEDVELHQGWKDIIDKIMEAAPELDVLLLGNSVNTDVDYNTFGVILQFEEKNSTSVSLIDSVPIVFSQNVAPEYLDSKFSYGTKKEVMYSLPQLSSAVINGFWKTAGNITQWKKPNEI